MASEHIIFHKGLHVKTKIRYYLLKFLTGQYQILVRWWSNLNSLALLGEWKIQMLLEKQFGNFYNIKDSCTLWSSKSTSRYLPKSNDYTCQQKVLYMNVYNNFILNKLEKLECSLLGEWIRRRKRRKYIALLVYYSIIKKEQSIHIIMWIDKWTWKIIPNKKSQPPSPQIIDVLSIHAKW